MKFGMFLFCFSMLLNTSLLAQDIKNNPTSNHGNRFEQLGTILPTPNEYRTASGAPGPKYWQQRCDYDIVASLDEDQRKLTGSETITYYNNSPDELSYLWLQLDENEHSSKNNAGYETSSTLPNRVTAPMLGEKYDKDYGFNIVKVTDAANSPIPYTINKTMMRVDLPEILKPGQKFVFKIDWNYFLVDRLRFGGRGGYEHFEEDGNDIFTIAQWYPRLCVYSDYQGWQNQQFVGAGEFALTFGNFNVDITVPADHVVMATGEGQNFKEVLTPQQYDRWQKAQNSKEIVEIVTLAEAVAREKKRSKETKTWKFSANMVRDFALGSSRKFVWDAMPTWIEGKRVMCMSGYGKEAYPLYRRFSTKAVAHTIQVYSKHTIPYPYPVAQSIEAANGMEYPMICFNFGRTEKDGTYSEGTKYGMIGVIIHEVGHNFFPMIVNSDERQWTWMDEGLNTFMQYISEELWDNKYPTSRGPAHKIVDYMKLPKSQLEPIMTNSENIIMFGPNAYAKPAAGLNILRETVMGRELFDYAFKTYARRWAFKHPTPADFFRTMEDASAENLDWFWRGWFYGIEPCDISLDSVRWSVVNTEPGRSNTREFRDTQYVDKPNLNDFEDISKIRNREDKQIQFATDADTSLQDFYWKYARNKVKVDEKPVIVVNKMNPDNYSTSEIEKIAGDVRMYELSFSNKGGLVMPVIIEWIYTDGSREVERFSAQIWRKNEDNFRKAFVKYKEVAAIRIDPMRETADIDETNNTWNISSQPSKFQLFKTRQQRIRGTSTGGNPMQRQIN